MHILIVTLGSHGDMHPFIGLAQVLARRGHDVTLLAPAIYESLSAQHQLKFAPVGTLEQFEEFAANPDIWHKVEGFKIVAGGTVAMIPDCYRAIEQHHIPGKTILVMSSLGLAGRIAQEKLNIPGVTVHLSPSIFRSVYVPPLLPPLPLAAWQPKWFKQTIYWALDRFAIDPLLAPKINAFRATLNLPPVKGIFGDWLNSPQRIIGMFPEWFAPMQPDWPAQTVLTGFPLYDERDVTAMPEALLKFLDESAPPIAFTPGSGMRHGQEFFSAAVAACGRLRRRGLLLTRHREHLPANLPPDILHVDFAPFSQLLPRCAALVHHGGVGTLSQALAAGVPQVVMPMAHDQPDNAERLRKLGVTAVVPAAKFNVESLAKALKNVIESPETAAACKMVARKFDGMRALDAAADAVEKLTP